MIAYCGSAQKSRKTSCISSARSLRGWVLSVSRKVLVCVAAFLAAPRADAEICEYRLSSLLGTTAATGVGAVSRTLAVSPLAFEGAGFYLIAHSTSGAIMIGSTAAGTSAAGTVGIIGGTGSGLGAAVAVVTSPFVTVPAAVAALATAGLEVGCYFQDERIDDPVMIYTLLQSIVAGAPATQIGLFILSNEIWLRVADETGTQQVFRVRDLYLVNGELMHRDWFTNSSLGYVAAKGA